MKQRNRQRSALPCVYINRKSETVTNDNKFRIILCRQMTLILIQCIPLEVRGCIVGKGMQSKWCSSYRKLHHFL